MGIANRIINILVLVAAIGAIVLGIMLFNKREDVADSHKKMATAIAENTAKLIKEEDAKNARKLTVAPAELAITKSSDEFQIPLKKFGDATKKIIQQRNALSDYVVELTGVVSENQGMDAFSATRLADYSQNPDEATKITARVNERIELAKKNRAAFVASVQTLNAKLKMDTLDAAKSSAENPDADYLKTRVDAIAEKAGNYVERSEALGQHVKAISSIFSIDEPAIENADYASLLQTQRSALEQKMQTLNDLKTAKEQLTKENQEQKVKIEEATAAAEGAKKLVSIREKELENAQNEIKRLRQIITPVTKTAQASGEENVNASHNQLKMIQAKVIHADAKLGFVIIDMGKKAKVTSKNAQGKKVETSVTIPPNAVMTVASSLDPATATFNGKIQITEAGEKESVANILPSPGKVMPAVGDVVYFSNYDLESVRIANEKRLKEMQRQAAGTASAVTAEKSADDENLDELLGVADTKKEEKKADAPAAAAPAAAPVVADDEVL